ncbi:MAG: hypothetical protein QM820_05880 [Minicystis sp.]
MHRSSILAAILPAVVVLAGCDDNKKASEQSAADELAHIVPLAKEDVAQVKRGLPVGAEKLGKLLDPDTLANPAAVQKAIGRARADVKDSEIAKSTWFSYADTTGTVLRSEADPDMLAGKSVLVAFPALKKALDPAGGVAEGFGEMKELKMAKTGPDMAWLAAAPVKDDKGAVKGMFVSGWSFRAFVYHLEQAAKMAVSDAATKKGKKNPPLVYIYLLKGKTAYGAPGTPDVNAKAVEDMDLLGKTAGGNYRGSTEITNRVFGVAGARFPEMGDDAALAVLASEI